MKTNIKLKEKEIVQDMMELEVTVLVNDKKVDVHIESSFDAFSCEDSVEFTLDPHEEITIAEEKELQDWILNREWNK